MQEAYVKGDWEQIVSFMRSLFNSTFKTNPYLERGLMTGITRVSKEFIFSDLNHLEVVTTSSDKYATSFGFTEEEVFAALGACGMSAEKEKVKTWYDGFILGQVSKLLQKANKRVKASFEELLEGRSICCAIDEQVVFGNLGDNEKAVWSLLVASGYLKILSFDKAQELEEGEEVKYQLALTNHEVKRMFQSMVRSWFLEVEAEYGDFITALLQGDVEAMNEYMNWITMEMFSYFDTGKNR